MILIGKRAEFLNALRTLARTPEDALRELMQCFGGSKARNQVDELISLADRRAAAQIDAGACGTARDWRAAHRAEDELARFLAELYEEPWGS